MKCIILGLDGLEYNIVEKFDFQALKQEEYGKIRIPRELYIEVSCEPYKNPVYEPWTPLIWFSFITGRFPSEEFKQDMKALGVWNSNTLNNINKLMKKLIKLRLDDMSKIKKILELLGFRKRLPLTRDYNVPTIFDLTEKSIAIDVPTYTENWPFGLEARPNENLRNFIDRALNYELERFNFVKNKVLSLLEDDDWELLMMYSKLLDTFGELSFNEKLISAYHMVNDFAKKIKTLVGDSSFILIISDHGIERMGKTTFGKHSDYGFYSSNISLGLNTPKHTDFFNVIKKVIKANSREDLGFQ